MRLIMFEFENVFENSLYKDALDAFKYINDNYDMDGIGLNNIIYVLKKY